tara:strand:+ start:1992 stop:2114 length:123 start_codon:yes stop_codon:yes gene_type:complete
MSEEVADASRDEIESKGGKAKWWLIGTGAFLALFYTFCGF